MAGKPVARPNALIGEKLQSASDGRRWAGLPPKERKRRLLRWAELIEARRLELAVLQIRDMAMPIALALHQEMVGVVACLRWYAEATDKLDDEIAPTAEMGHVQRAPTGCGQGLVRNAG